MLRKLAFAALFSSLAGGAVAEPFSFVALGDMPYGDPAEVYGAYEALIGEVNRQAPELVLHIGDTKSGSTPCSDRILADQLRYLNSFDAAVIYTPGDNEWTDCHRAKAGGYDPLERLAHIRRHYFADPAASLGLAPVAVAHQGARGYPENTRLAHRGVVFIAAHVVGSNNNFEPGDVAAATEFSDRNAATADWLAEGFAAAAGADAVVVAIHADIFDTGFNRWGDEGWPSESGFATFGPALQRAAAAFGKPVLLVFGDTHTHRVLRPFPKTAPNVIAMEVFGAKEMHAVAVLVDPAGPEPFTFAPVRNPALP